MTRRNFCAGAVALLLVAYTIMAPQTGQAASTRVNGFGEAAVVLATAVIDYARPQQGVVLDVNGSDVYINLGREKRIREGQLLQVVRPTRELRDPVTGEVIGFVETPVGLLEVTQVRDTFSVGRLLTGGGPVEPGDRVYSSGEALSLAVLPFSLLTGESLVQGMIFSERLAALLAGEPSLSVVERVQLDRALAELDFGRSGLVDAATAQELGSFLGVSTLVVGTMAETGSAVTVTMRLLEVRTGRVLLALTLDVLGETLSSMSVERPMGAAFTPSSTMAGISSTLSPAGSRAPALALPLAAFGSSNVNLLFRQELPERLHRIVVGDLQNRGENLVGIDANTGRVYVYRLTDSYTKLWETSGAELEPVYLRSADGKQRGILSGKRWIFWNPDNSRWVNTGSPEGVFDWTLPAAGTTTEFGGYYETPGGAWVPLLCKFLPTPQRFRFDCSFFGAHLEVQRIGYPLFVQPYPGGEYVIVQYGEFGELRVLDRRGEIQWRSRDLAAVVSAAAADINGDGLHEIVVAQIVDETGKPNPDLIQRLIRGEVSRGDSVHSQLVVLSWSKELLALREVARSDIIRGQRVWDMRFSEATRGRVPELVVLAGPLLRNDPGPSSVYRFNITIAN